MKTYTTTIEKPRLVIQQDSDAESPRHDTNLGYFITCDSRHNSPDKPMGYIQMIEDTSKEAKDQADHIRLIKREINRLYDEKVLAIYPITKHEHGNVYYSMGTVKGFDNSNNGFYIVTNKTATDGAGVLLKGTKKQLETYYRNTIQRELESYNKWMNGEIYCFTLYTSKGEEIEHSGGYEDIEAIRDNLPKEWAKEDLTAYIQN